MKNLIWHVVIVSTIILISAIMNSYNLTVLSSEMAKKRTVLRRMSWVEDSIKHLRYSTYYEQQDEIYDEGKQKYGKGGSEIE